MQRVVELASSLPTVIFSSLLLFCLAWWAVSIVVSGADGADSDVDGDAEGDLFGRAAHSLGMGSVPFALGLTVLSFGAWASSLLLSLAADALAVDGLASLGVAVVIVAAATVSGVWLLRRFARATQPLFTTHTAPSRSDNIGAQVRVRTTVVTDAFGQAEVLTGPLRGAVVKVRATEGRFRRGSVALVVDFDTAANAYEIDELPPELSTPPPG